MPGITSVEIHNKGAYGSLRQATVNFQCWDIKQLEILETLYMRPGYTVLLEFGRNNYFENGKLNPIRYKDDFFTQQNVDLHSYLNDLHKRATDSKGHYDSLFGYITNYAWNARGDGGYDCKTEIISTGEILESLNFRGGNHYDSNVYPYIATALVRGKWNINEYPNELGNILKNYNIEINKRGIFNG